MKKIYLSTLAIVLIGMTMAGCNEDKATKTEVKVPAAQTLLTQAEKVGYT